jgi:predicted RNase H-like HicB family nuclease
MTLQIVLEPSEEGGFTATVPSLPGCISEGRDRAVVKGVILILLTCVHT